MKYYLCIFSFLFISLYSISETYVAKDSLDISGGLRYAYTNASWDRVENNDQGQILFDALILKVQGQMNRFNFAFESRYYSQSNGGFMLRNAYLGVTFFQNMKLKIGMPRTPFGLIDLSDYKIIHNMPYYIGFEEDADLGVTVEYSIDRFDLFVNFAKNSENTFGSIHNRYAYDLSGENHELNQLTLRLDCNLGHYKIGYSVQCGQIYNKGTDILGDRFAQELHAIYIHNCWDIKAQLMCYDYEAFNKEKKNYIFLGGRGNNFKVSKQGIITVLNVGYTIPINSSLLNDIKIYNDFSSLHKKVGNMNDSYMNVTGCMLHSGPIYIMFDYILAQNHPWAGTHADDAFFDGTSSDWERQLNVNIGVYF